MFFPEINIGDEVRRQIEDVLKNDYGYSEGINSKNEKYFVWSQTGYPVAKLHVSKLYIAFEPLGALHIDLEFTENDRGSIFKSYKITPSFSKGYFQHRQCREEDITANLITDLKEALDKTDKRDWFKY